MFQLPPLSTKDSLILRCLWKSAQLVNLLENKLYSFCHNLLGRILTNILRITFHNTLWWTKCTHFNESFKLKRWTHLSFLFQKNILDKEAAVNYSTYHGYFCNCYIRVSSQIPTWSFSRHYLLLSLICFYCGIFLLL